ncbi:hypothetical protein J6590_100871 [Homalodisca vitripennis]|nr:hypothetical protein J6590_100871 [Homalodisca vitripennis]
MLVPVSGPREVFCQKEVTVYDAQPLRYATPRHGSPHAVGFEAPSHTKACVLRLVMPDRHHYCAAQSAQSGH